MFERLRFLAEGEDAGGKGGAGGGATPPEGDAAAKAAADKAAADAEAAKAAAAAKDGKDEKDGKGAAGGKDGESKDKNAAASDYVVKLPEGMKEGEVNKEQLDSFTKFAKDEKLSPDQATKALAYWKSLNDAESTRWAKQDQDWYGTLEKDAEFGGANLKASEAALQTALKRFDTGGELAKDLAKYGLENLPSLAKFIARVGKAGGEDKSQVDRDGKGAPKAVSGADRRKAFYDDMGTDKKTE